MHENLLVSMLFHRSEKRFEIGLRWGIEQHRNVDVLHSQGPHCAWLVPERVARVVMKSEVDDDLEAFASYAGKLSLRWLSRGSQPVIHGVVPVDAAQRRRAHRSSAYRAGAVPHTSRRARRQDVKMLSRSGAEVVEIKFIHSLVVITAAKRDCRTTEVVV